MNQKQVLNTVREILFRLSEIPRDAVWESNQLGPALVFLATTGDDYINGLYHDEGYYVEFGKETTSVHLNDSPHNFDDGLDASNALKDIERMQTGLKVIQEIEPLIASLRGAALSSVEGEQVINELLGIAAIGDETRVVAECLKTIYDVVWDNTRALMTSDDYKDDLVSSVLANVPYYDIRLNYLTAVGDCNVEVTVWTRGSGELPRVKLPKDFVLTEDTIQELSDLRAKTDKLADALNRAVSMARSVKKENVLALLKAM